MSVKILIDMNLSPDWVSLLTGQGWSVVLRQYDASLEAGALVVVDERKCRVRILPL